MRLPVELLTYLIMRSQEFIDKKLEIAKVVVKRRPGGTDLFADLVDAQVFRAHLRKIRVSMLQPFFLHLSLFILICKIGEKKE